MFGAHVPTVFAAERDTVHASAGPGDGLRVAFHALRDSAAASLSPAVFVLHLSPGLYRLDRPLHWDGDRHGGREHHLLVQADPGGGPVVISGAWAVLDPGGQPRLLREGVPRGSTPVPPPFRFLPADSTGRLVRTDRFFDWGVLDISDYKARYRQWMENVERPELLRRREMVIVDGSLLQQRLLQHELLPGCFRIEGGHRTSAGPDHPRPRQFWFANVPGHPSTDGLPDSTHVTDARLWLHLDRPLAEIDSIEIPVSPGLLILRNLDRVELRGIRFQHANPFHAGSTVTLAAIPSARVEGCEFVEGNWRGLQVGAVPLPVDRARPDSLEIIACRAVGNGAYGMSASRVARLRLEGCTTSWNNRRGFAAGTEAWAVGGMKLFKVSDVTVAGHTASFNQATGLWFDTACERIVIEGGLFEGNSRDGLFLEANPGPIVVSACSFINNGRDGLRLNSSDRVRVQHGRFVHNGFTGVRLADLGRETVPWKQEADPEVESRVHRGTAAVFAGNTFLGPNSFAKTRHVNPFERWVWIWRTEFRDNTCIPPDRGSPFNQGE